jgi:hypothetical protein
LKDTKIKVRYLEKRNNKMKQLCKVCGLPCKSRKDLQEHMKSIRHFNFSNVVDHINLKKKKSNEYSKEKKSNEYSKEKKSNECPKKKKSNIGSAIGKTYMGPTYKPSSNHQPLGKRWVVEEFVNQRKKHKVLA